MGGLRRLIGSMLAAAGGALATAGWYKYDAMNTGVGRAMDKIGVPHDDSTWLAYVMMGGGAALVLAGVMACVRKDK